MTLKQIKVQGNFIKKLLTLNDAVSKLKCNNNTLSNIMINQMISKNKLEIKGQKFDKLQ
jgi:hypothetical protein